MGNLTQKGKFVPWKGQWHWQTTKSVYIYTFVFTGTYTGPFCHNPVESCGILWNPVEWMHSCRNLWGIKKYSRKPSNWNHGGSDFQFYVERSGRVPGSTLALVLLVQGHSNLEALKSLIPSLNHLRSIFMHLNMWVSCIWLSLATNLIAL